MDRAILYTYKNVEEFNIYYAKKKEDGILIHPFLFQETAEILKDNPESVIDITSLIAYLSINSNDINATLNNLIYADETTVFIIRENYQNLALELLYVFFEKTEALGLLHTYQDAEDFDEDFDEVTKMFERRDLYIYYVEQLEEIKGYCTKNDIPFINISELHKLSNKASTYLEDKKYFLDITTLIQASDDNQNLLFVAEQLLFNNINATVLVNTSVQEKAMSSLPLSFKSAFSINELIGNIKKPSTPEKEDHTLTKITDLNKADLANLFEKLELELVGHKNFKDRFKNQMETFLLLNRIGEKSVYSTFLLGPTGVGKTEFALLLGKSMNPSTNIIKINFGNYSSQDALNSLIGSPRGYIGSDEGELSKKLKKSKVGVILCDEFEKAEKNIVNFFLELLETGVFTDSQGEAHNLNGYIIIFTSNLNNTSFKEKISPEFISRLDLICEFDLLTDYDKSDFVKRYVVKLTSKLDFTLSCEDVSALLSIDICGLNNIRDIKRSVINELQKILESKDNRESIGV